MVSRSAYLTNLGLTYHYSFNGKENDADVKGDGNQQDYGMRIYDPRLGRFLSLDPITKEYPELTPYQFASNTPISGIDKDGMEHEDSKSVWEIIKDALFSTEKYKGGAKTFAEGNEQSALAESGQADYQQQPGISTFQRNWMNFQNKWGGRGKMVQGTVDMFEATAEASSNLIPIERIVTGVRGLSKGVPVLKKLNFNVAERLTQKVLSPTQKTAILQFVENIKLKAKPSEFTRLETLNGNKDSRAVGDIMAKLKAGIKLEPIKVYMENGVKYVLDGHHRLEAATRLGQEIEYKILTLEEALKEFSYKSAEQIKNAATETTKNKLDSKLVNKMANGDR
jgi:RHS repeat-associated protein